MYFSGSSPDVYEIGYGSSREYSKKRVKVKRIINHENYKFPDYDFSLLELAEPLNFDDKIQPIALPNADLQIRDGAYGI